jgi:hypothetical protein
MTISCDADMLHCLPTWKGQRVDFHVWGSEDGELFSAEMGEKVPLREVWGWKENLAPPPHGR